jgi:hypothetical protein
MVAEPARAAPVPEPNIHPATGKRKGSLALFTADRSAPRGSLGCAPDDPQQPGGIRVALVPRRPGLPPPPVRPTRGAWPVARLRAAPCGPRASAGAASRASSGPFEVEARPQRSPSVLPRATLTERPPWGRILAHPRLEDELESTAGSNQNVPSLRSPSVPRWIAHAVHRTRWLPWGVVSAGRVQRPAAAIASSRWMKSRIATIVPSRISTT